VSAPIFLCHLYSISTRSENYLYARAAPGSEGLSCTAAGQLGGALLQDSSDFTIERSVFASNRAASQGGAIYQVLPLVMLHFCIASQGSAIYQVTCNTKLMYCQSRWRHIPDTAFVMYCDARLLHIPGTATCSVGRGNSDYGTERHGKQII
jgi:hypothetical protein